MVRDKSEAIRAHVVSGARVVNSKDHVVDGGGRYGGFNAMREEETEGFRGF